MDAPQIDRRETLRQTFDGAAELYDRVRPGYPERLFDDLFALAGLEPGANVLEIGCGTGQASQPLARRGCRLVCVELGERLAEVARRNLAEFPQVHVVTDAFEIWEPNGRTFDMVFAATSWHWLDPSVRYEKAARLLKSGGVLAMVNTVHAFPTGFDPFFTEIQDCYDAIGESASEWPPPEPDKVSDAREEIQRSGLFGEVHVERYLWTVDYTASQYVDLLETYSGHREMDPAKRGLLYAEVRKRIDARPDPRVHKHYLTILHVARARNQTRE
jgi:SAM-dependent methyltransferase